MPPKRRTDSTGEHKEDKPTVKALALEYLDSLDSPTELSAKAFAIAVASKMPTARHKHLVLEWNQLRAQHMDPAKGSHLQEAFAAAPMLSLEMIKRYIDEHFAPSSSGLDQIALSKVSNAPSPASGPLARAKRARSGPALSPSTTSQSTTGSSRSSSSSSSSLSSSAVQRMADEFVQHYKEYTGRDWTLPSGTIADQILCSHIRTLTKESVLHSFVIQRTRPLLSLFDAIDADAFQKHIADSDKSEAQGQLINWQRATIEQYDASPKEIWNKLKGGWATSDLPQDVDASVAFSFRCSVYQTLLDLATVYRTHQYRLPQGKKESWYTTKVWGFLWKIIDAGGVLEYEPGEATSAASSLRKNSERDLESKQSQGRKIDGIVSCLATNLEICAVEAGKLDQGQSGTKILQDSVKMAKVLKDMFDAIHTRSNGSEAVKRELRTYGLLISGTRIDFVSFRHLEGRFFRMQTEDSVTLPPVWDEHGVSSKTIVAVVYKLMLFKSRVEKMANNIALWVQVSLDITASPDDSRPIVATMTTPGNSPRR
ncbi:hypothetical protein CPC16_002851 [Podila verticillata]|nr:hypothetical protein BGZ52_009226 [Haplosporangium bisporale]KAF9371787.1 hypothetical protein CPC16_002851 [Podila verticillata]